MKKFFGKLKDLFYGALPILILFGIPTVIALAIFIIFNWDNLKMLSFVDIIGIIFGTIGVFNISVGILLAVKKMIEKKLKAYWIVIYIILTVAGIFVFSKMIV